MSTTLSSDIRGVIVTCQACGTGNRMAYSRLHEKGRCGSCKEPLPAAALPVEVPDAACFQALVSQSSLPVAVDFWAQWCGPCRMMAPEFAKAAALLAGQAVLAKVDTERLPDVAAQFRIQGIPAFLLFRQGRVAGQTAGFQQAASLASWISQT